MEVPTGPRNAPNGFSVQFYPRWDVRLPFSQKIFSENPKNSKKSFRSLSESKQEKKSRLKSDFSNLVKSALPGFRLFPDLILMDTIVCPPPSPVPCPPQQLTRGLRVIRNIPRHIPRANNSTAWIAQSAHLPPSHLPTTAAHSGTSRYSRHIPRANNGTAWTLQFAPLSAGSSRYSCHQDARKIIVIIFEMFAFIQKLET